MARYNDHVNELAYKRHVIHTLDACIRELPDDVLQCMDDKLAAERIARTARKRELLARDGRHKQRSDAHRGGRPLPIA